MRVECWDCGKLVRVTPTTPLSGGYCNRVICGRCARRDRAAKAAAEKAPFPTPAEKDETAKRFLPMGGA